MALSISIKSTFRNAFQENCIKLLIDAYNMALDEKIIQLDWDENDISAQLHVHITNSTIRKKWKISSNVESHKPADELDTPKIKGFSSKLSRIDLRFATFGLKDEYEYFFESKRLKEKDSGLKRRYITTGIDNFISDKYSNCSLIGYVLEGAVEANVKGINSLLTKDKRASETLSPVSTHLHDSYFESNHTNVGILKHLMFDFTSL